MRTTLPRIYDERLAVFERVNIFSGILEIVVGRAGREELEPLFLGRLIGFREQDDDTNRTLALTRKIFVQAQIPVLVYTSSGLDRVHGTVTIP